MDTTKNNPDILINFINDADKYIIYADLCGVRKEDLHVQIKGKTLIISGERDFDSRNGFWSTGIKRGNLQKIIKLEDNIDLENIETEYKDGLLKIVIPKMENITADIEIS